MRTMFFFGLLVFALCAQATSTLRVGNRVLSAGDSAERVTELLGKPSSRSHRSGAHSGSRGRSSGRSGRGKRGAHATNRSDQPAEQWRYRRDGHSTVITLIDGKVTDIEDRRL